MVKPALLNFCWIVFASTSLFLRAGEPMRIRLEDGSFGSGHIVGVENAKRLGWQSDVFESRFEFDLHAVRSINRMAELVTAEENNAQDSSAPRQFFELADGTMVVGRLVGMDNAWIAVDTDLMGTVNLDRTQTRAMVDAGYAGRLIYSGPAEDEHWQPLGDEADWEFEAGALVAQKQRVMISGKVDLPAKSQTTLSLSWRGTPDFVISLGTPLSLSGLKSEEIPSAARLEVWANQLALVREVDGGADIAMLADLSESNPRIDLTVYLDQDTGVVLVCDAHGRPLETLNVPGEDTPLRPSVHIANNGPALTIERIEVREWDGVASAITASGEYSVLGASGKSIQGAIAGFDTDSQQLQIKLSNGEESTLALNALRRGDFLAPSEYQGDAAEDDLPPAVVQPEALDTEPKATSDEAAFDALTTNDSSGSKTEESSVVARDDIEVVLMDRTRLKGKWLEASSADALRFEPNGLQNKVGFSVAAIRGIIGATDRFAYVDSGMPMGTIKVGDNQFKGFLDESSVAESETGLRWRPTGSATSSAISSMASGAIVYREPLPKIQPRTPAQENPNIRILAPAVGMFLGGKMPNVADVAIKKNDAAAQDGVNPDAREIMFRTGDAVDGIVERIDERGMTFRSAQTSTTFAPHELITHVWLNKLGDKTDTTPEKLARLMTIPRSMKKDPPTHLFIATTGDYLRGRLLSLEGEKLTVEIRFEIVELPVVNIAQIVWLHDRNWDEQDQVADNVNAETEQKTQEKGDSPFLVHAIGKADRGLTFRPLKVSGGVLSGRGDLLGDCAVAVSDLRQLLFGRNIAEQIRSFREDPWTLSLAQYPRVYLEDGSEAGPAGDGSPLVGKPAIDFTLKSLSGQAFRLSKQRDRIVVLDFWASWCGPCIQTMPLVDEIVTELGSDKIHLVAVNIQESAAKAQVAVDRLEVAATVLLDSDGQTAAAYAANAIPQTVIIDRNGLVTHVFVGGGPKFVKQLKEALQAVIDTPIE